MSDRIVIKGIEAHGHHGVLATEREHGQRFVVDVSIGLDLAPAATTDDLGDTVDYATLAADVHALVAGPPADLVETLADRIARRCLDDPRVTEVEVTVHKPDAPVEVPFSDVAVTLLRRAVPGGDG